MRRGNLWIAALSAIIGVSALAITLSSGNLLTLGTVLGVVMLLNAVVRYRIAQEK